MVAWGRTVQLFTFEPSSKLVVPGLVLQREIETYGKFWSKIWVKVKKGWQLLVEKRT